METLPNELLFSICDLLDRPTRKSIRLASRRLAEAAAPTVFSHLNAAFFGFSLNRLLRISECEHLRHSVKSITLYDSILPPCQDQLDFQSKFDIKQSVRSVFSHHSDRLGSIYFGTPKKSSYVYGLKSQDYNRYQAFYREQQASLTDDFTKDMQKCLSRFSNLYEVGIKQLHNELSSPLPKTGSTIAINPSLKNICQYPGGTVKCPVWLENHINRHVGGVLEVLSRRTEGFQAASDETSGGQLKSLSLGHVLVSSNSQSWHQVGGRWQRLQVHTKDILTQVNGLENIFKHLTKLKLDIFCVYSDFQGPNLSDLSQSLSKADALEELSLSWRKDPTVAPKGDTLQCVEDIKWKNLKRVSLNLWTSEKTLVAFLTNHASTLQELALVDTMILKESGSWASALKELREGLNLSDISIETSGANHHGYDFFHKKVDVAAVRKFILHGGTFPYSVLQPAW